jgi:hypothetical protein
VDIREAKRQIKRSMKAYFAKDEYGEYLLPAHKQRPVFLLGAPGIGKTAIIEQIAQELDVSFVSYSMTHHTRQSALGLPFIAKREFQGEEYDVSEYTMSEIIASVYETMEATGKKEGILFLDEINCVSETLTPAMLQFLQYKIFGRHKVPDGWIVVTAGNPTEYNKTARDFDIATWDRLKRIDVEPDFGAWRVYAVDTGVHPAIITYLDIEHDFFYHIETTVDGTYFVTARGWDDLSSIIKLYEKLDIPVDDNLIEQYIQVPDIAHRFSAYYDLFKKYRSDYQIDSILKGEDDTAIVERAKAAGFDERISLMGLITDALCDGLRDTVLHERALGFLHTKLADMRNSIVQKLSASAQADELDAANVFEIARDIAMDIEHQMRVDRENGLLTTEKRISYQRALTFFDDIDREAGGSGTISFGRVKEKFSDLVDELEREVNESSLMVDRAFSFVERAFGDGQEMLLLVTDITANRYGMAFVNDHGSESYFKHNKELLFYERGGDLANRIKQLNLDTEE